MKSKLRTIIFDNVQYKYIINESFNRIPGAKLGFWVTILRIFKSGFKNTPLEITFQSVDAYALGNLLTHNSNELNLNKPGIIRNILEEGLKYPWNWKESSFKIEDGLGLLEHIGFNIDDLKTNFN